MPTSASNFSGVWQSLQPPMVTSNRPRSTWATLSAFGCGAGCRHPAVAARAVVRANPIVSRCVRFVMVSSVVESFVSRSPTNGVARTTMAKPADPIAKWSLPEC